MAYLGSILVSLFLSMVSSMQSQSSTTSSTSATPTAPPTGAPSVVVVQPTPALPTTPTTTTATTTTATTGGVPPAVPTPVPSATPTQGSGNTSVLVYGGQGANPSFLNCLMSDLSQAGFDPQQLDSSGLSALTSADLAHFAALIIPEGNASTMSSVLTPGARGAIRAATQTGGLNFLGLGNGALLGLGGSSGNPLASLLPVGLDLLQGLASGTGAGGGGSSGTGNPLSALQNIFGVFGNGQPALSQTPTVNGGGVSVLMPSPDGSSLSCGQPPQVFSTGTGGSTGGTPAGQLIANPVLSLIQQALNRA